MTAEELRVALGMPKIYRRVGFYRGVRYEYDSMLPEGKGHFYGGGPPDYLRAVRVAGFSLFEGVRWNAWFRECVRVPDGLEDRCGHAFDSHRGGFECTKERWDLFDDFYPVLVCECEGFVRRAPLVVIE